METDTKSVGLKTAAAWLGLVTAVLTISLLIFQNLNAFAEARSSMCAAFGVFCSDTNAAPTAIRPQASEDTPTLARHQILTGLVGTWQLVTGNAPGTRYCAEAVRFRMREGNEADDLIYEETTREHGPNDFIFIGSHPIADNDGNVHFDALGAWKIEGERLIYNSTRSEPGCVYSRRVE